jgi:hypothetical protein
MARIVDYLPFAINTGANVEGQSSYVIDPIRLTGHQAGVAKSAVVNKSLRQHSVMSAALANLLSEALDVDVLDDGDVVALKNMLQDVLMGGRATIMTSDMTLYVRTTGSNNNDGLTPTTAFATPQYAADYAYSSLQLNGYGVWIDIGPGTFGGVVLNAALVGQRGAGGLVFAGAGKGSTTISTTKQCFNLGGQAAAVVTGLRMTAMGGTLWGDGCLLMAHNSNVGAIDVDFGPVQAPTSLVFGNQIHMSMGSALTLGNVDKDYFYNISGGGGCWGAAMAGSLLMIWNSKFTLTGTPAYTNAFVGSSASSMVASSGAIPPGTGSAFSGSATGTRFAVDGVSRITSADSTATFYPGSIAGYAANSNVQGNYT